jgi:uncharacterized repeat protein (TIGR03803 family)
MRRSGFLSVGQAILLALTVAIATAAAADTELVLHNFTTNVHGRNPQANLIADAAGNLYGVALGGGTSGYGVVFKLSLAGGKWTQTVLYNFTGGADGGAPQGALVFDGAGNLYGEALNGGSTTCYNGCGLVYKVSPNANGSWTESVIYDFVGGSYSTVANGSLIFDKAGNLYGVGGGGLYQQGTVFELTTNSQGQWTETVLYNFTGLADGGTPDGALVFDPAGNLYGTTVSGGDPNCSPFNQPGSCGVVYKLANNGNGTWTQSTLLQFEGINGSFPIGNVVLDADGNIYGLTSFGPGDGCGCGTFFRLAPTSSGGWTYSLLYTFAGGPDAAYPNGGLTEDSLGNFYGTSYGGGVTGCGYGCGTVFEISPSTSKTWKEKVLFKFIVNGFAGETPYAGVYVDAAGNLYGTASEGGVDCVNNLGCGGAVYELSPASGKWVASSLYQFAPGADGLDPLASLVRDGTGNLYVPTGYGGTASCSARSCGAAFEFSPLAIGGWSEHLLANFTSTTISGQFVSAFILDSSGNLYGTQQYGGNVSCNGLGCGSVFELSPSANGAWQQTVLYSFQGGSDGQFPAAALTFDANGNLFGTTSAGGGAKSCCGTVFELTPSSTGWSKKTLYTFTGTPDGNLPNNALVFDSAGNLYGTTELGGSSNVVCAGGACGTVFKLSPGMSGTWSETLVHAFTGTDDGRTPAAVTIDAEGNLFGTTYTGGKDATTYCSGGCGTVFEFAPSSSGWTKSILYSFKPTEVPGDGATPFAGVAIGPDGSLYGTTERGGLNVSNECCGTVYKLSEDEAGQWSERILYAFDLIHGATPVSPVILDPLGDLFGSTPIGGTDGGGVIFEIIPEQNAPALNEPGKNRRAQ